MFGFAVDVRHSNVNDEEDDGNDGDGDDDDDKFNGDDDSERIIISMSRRIRRITRRAHRNNLHATAQEGTAKS